MNDSAGTQQALTYAGFRRAALTSMVLRVCSSENGLGLCVEQQFFSTILIHVPIHLLIFLSSLRSLVVDSLLQLLKQILEAYASLSLRESKSCGAATVLEIFHVQGIVILKHSRAQWSAHCEHSKE